MFLSGTSLCRLLKYNFHCNFCLFTTLYCKYYDTIKMQWGNDWLYSAIGIEVWLLLYIETSSKELVPFYIHLDLSSFLIAVFLLQVFSSINCWFRLFLTLFIVWVLFPKITKRAFNNQLAMEISWRVVPLVVWWLIL